MSEEEEKHSIKLDDAEENDKNVALEVEEDEDGEGDEDEQCNSGNIPEGASVPDGGSVPEGASQQPTKKRTHRKLDISNFIMKTYRILEDKRNSNIVEWTDEGNCFIVKDKQKFSREILPKYFKHSKFSSFVRQLNMYDFHKIRKQKEIPIFKHKHFKEGCMDQLHKIKRKNGEEGRDEEGISKEIVNLSEPMIGDFTSRQSIPFRNKTSTQLPAQSQIELLRKENIELIESIHEIEHEIKLLESSKEKKREKLVKIMSSLMFFDLNMDSRMGTMSNLRHLQQHFVKEEDTLSFSEYRQHLSNIYTGLKMKLML